MLQPPIPDPDDVLSRLSRLLSAVFQALEAGTLHGREYFEQRGEPINGPLYPNLVRYAAKCYLADKGHDVAEFVQEELANNGLWLGYAPYQIRILKSDHGAVPPPGKSRAKRDFYNQRVLQLPLPLIDGFTGVPIDQPLNLVILWDVTPTYNLAGLTLVCPKGGDVDRFPPDVYWHVVVPHPAETVQRGEGHAPSMDDGEDLDITLDDSEERGTGRA